MEATIQSNWIDVDKEEARPNLKVSNLPQERHIWRMPELPRFPKLHIKSFLGQEKTIELLRGWSPLSCKDKVKRIKNWLKNQSLLCIDQKKELEMTPDLETEGPVASTSSKPAPEVSKDKPKGPQKKQKYPKNHQGKGKCKANWNRPYPQGYRITKLEPSAVDSVFTMARTIMEFTAKEQEKMNRNFPCKQ
ncbi:hypothetical protein O181_116024 [Austropuccinia psidii MF-1]|uniref:Uncharacterized protein n=1 Tax=Austropuccinia psidii MF-1 TaxID=1389203 RepID=A0A9Q3KAQ1_9BASI|nr:hypothetical protein [Austropuccinia psidii MF-1]